MRYTTKLNLAGWLAAAGIALAIPVVFLAGESLTGKTEITVPNGAARCVVLVHGLFRGAGSMEPLAKRFRAAGYATLSFDYNPTDKPLAVIAGDLDNAIRALPSGIRVSGVVAHSFGTLVARQWSAGFNRDRRLRMVLIAPPAGTSAWARFLSRYLLFFERVLGEAAAPLLRGEPVPWPVPAVTGIIAGGRGNDTGYNPLIPGDDDFTVAVSETMLPGATERVLVRSQHTLLLTSDEAARNALSFIATGGFPKNN